MYVQSTFGVNTMEMKDVQSVQAYERRNIRINIRITPSQNKFIIDNTLSITKVMNEALKQLGYASPKPEDIPEEDKERGYEEERMYWKNKRVRVRGGKFVNRRIMQYRHKRRRH